MARSYQRLEELEEKGQPAGKSASTGRDVGTGKTPAFASLALMALLIIALGGALFYAARMRDNASAMKALAENIKKETVTVHQQIRMLEGERDSLNARVDSLTTQLKKTEDENSRLLKEIESLKKARSAPQKQDAKKSRKRA